MSFERIVAQEEIDEAVYKGFEKAKKVFKRAASTPDRLDFLKTAFKSPLKHIDKIFDNFYPHMFSAADRNNHLKTDAELKVMLLAAYQTVTYLTLLERAIDHEMRAPQRERGHVIEGYQCELVEATAVYRGNNKKPLMCGDSYKDPQPPMAA